MRLFKYLILFLLILSENSFSQKINFSQLTINDGLSQNAVFSILQDSKGFMWFATKDGLNRYDGKNFVVFQYNPFDTTTVSDNYITELYEDSRGLIWVGTLSGGINIFHRDTETFSRLKLRSKYRDIDNINEVLTITEGLKGDMWIGTKGDGIIRVTTHEKDPLNYPARQHLHSPGKSNSLSNNTISHLFVDLNNVLWIANEAGLNRYNQEIDGFDLFQFDTKHPEVRTTIV